MITSVVRQGCIKSPWLFNVYMDAVVKMGMGRRGVRFQEEKRECRLPGLLCADDLVLCGDSEEDLKVMGGHFTEVCRRRGLKINAGKSKVMVLGGEEELECEVQVDGIRLEHVLESKYLGCVLDKSECNRKVASERRVAFAIRSLVSAWSLHLQCARVLHESLMVPVLTCGRDNGMEGGEV